MHLDGQILAQMPHLPVLNLMQLAGSMEAFLGMAWGKGMLMAVVGPIYSLKGSGLFLAGHFYMQAPQPVQAFQST